jgi:hypothetical protein
MHRRHFLSTAASAALAAPALPAAAPARAIFELRYIRMRNGPQVERTSTFLSRYLAPAARRAGIGPMGFFSGIIAEQSPFILALISYPSLEAMGQLSDKLAGDKEFQRGADEYNSVSELSYIRMDNALLRAFSSMPAIEAPPSDGKRPARIFELRTYEANNLKASRRKIRMFDEGEIGIFRRLGMTPVFFGETLVGQDLPKLTYMLAFDDLASREKLWRAFGSDPEWQKMRAQPGVSDAEIVSNISTSILRPLPFSQIR